METNKHNHDELCGCGHEHHEHEHYEHEHSHEHHHDELCGCGHEHHDHEHTHEHPHDELCGCGHEHHDHEHHDHEHTHEHHHDELCGCGHEHEHTHEHHHDELCGCGHEHHDHEHHDHEHTHEHHHDELCGCGHEHHDHEQKHPQHSAANSGKYVYILENLDCANCAAKMESKINQLAGVDSATITFATKQLRLSANDPDALLPKIQEICTSIESEVKVVPKFKNHSGTSGKYNAKIYIIENLDCANCAAKMEDKINQLAGVETAAITFATKQLRVSGPDIPSIFPQIEAACKSIESDVKLIEKETAVRNAASAAKHEHDKNKKSINEQTLALIEIIAGAGLFIAGEIVNHVFPEKPAVSITIFVIAYLILGLEVVWTALKNLIHGQVFDENFLMSIATIGAFFTKDYPEAVGVMLFYRIGEFFEHKAVEKSRSQIMDTVDMRPETVHLVSGNDILTIPAENANVGDIVMIRPGDRIPLDGVVIEGTSRIDTSPVTGEPVPVKAGVGDEVISGCVNTSNQIKIRVEKVLEESMVTRILDSVENAAASKPKIDRFITKFARIYTPIVVALAVATAVIPSLITGNWNYWVYTALTFLVMSCPCALVLSVPLAFFSGIGAGSKIGILFKGGVSLEAMTNVKAVVMDKTGTITEGNFKVQKVVSTGIVSEDDLLAMSASCELSSTHPIGNSIVTAAKNKNLNLIRPERVEEIAGCGIKATNNNQTVLCGNRKLMQQFGIDLSKYTNDQYGTEVLIAIDGKYAGCIIISDTLKPDAKDAIAKLKQNGIIPAMLTGDAKESAENIAKAAGIHEVHAQLMPQDKLNKLKDIRSNYGSVMFVGDGINDAPVLAGADVGAAMGSGADAAIEAADVVFMTSKMQAIPQAISIAKATSRISWQNVIFALTVKIIVMILGLCGLASMWMAVFADTGVAMLCIINSIKILYGKKFK